MNRAVTTAILVAAVALVAALPATAAGPTPTERKLQKQVAALQKDVKTLKKQMKDQQDLDAALVAAIFCNAAITADALQGTWNVIDQISQATAGRPAIGPQTAVNDSGTCQALEVPRSQASPPGLFSFRALLALLSGSASQMSSSIARAAVTG